MKFWVFCYEVLFGERALKTEKIKRNLLLLDIFSTSRFKDDSKNGMKLLYHEKGIFKNLRPFRNRSHFCKQIISFK